MPKSQLEFDNETKRLLKAFDSGLAREAFSRARRSQNTKRNRFVESSEQAACMPEQVAEANETCRALGIAATYRPDGTVDYGGKRARERHLRSIGKVDNS